MNDYTSVRARVCVCVSLSIMAGVSGHSALLVLLLLITTYESKGNEVVFKTVRNVRSAHMNSVWLGSDVGNESFHWLCLL